MPGKDNDATGRENDRHFVRRFCIAIGLGSLVFLAWNLRLVLVLLFGAVVIATIFKALAEPIVRHLRAPHVIAVSVAALIVISIVGCVGWLLGAQIAGEIDMLTESFPQAMSRLDSLLGGAHLLDQFRSWFAHLGSSGDMVARIQGFLGTASQAVTNFLIVLFGGLFLATDPNLYRAGAIKLVPPERRATVARAMDESSRALRLWLKGQLLAMLVVGLMTGVGLWLIGVPSALVLGILAGFFEFIPFAGPILAAVPGVLIALSQSPDLALWTIAMYVLVQHSEAYLIQPLIQQYAVDVPAVVLLFSLLAFAMLFGAVGIVFAAPLTVVTYVMVKRLYVIETLDTDTPIPGEKS